MRLGPFGRRAEPEDEGWETELWAALEEQGESVAAGFSWIEDPTFVWVAAGQLLTALGALPETIRPLGQLRPLLDEVRALEGGGEPGGELIPLAPERVQDMVDRAVPIVVPLLREVLESLRARRIRTELVGLDAEELRRSLDRLEAFYRDGAWRTMDADEIAAQLELLVADPAVEPVAPSVGELRRIVGVLRDMPRPTLQRITKVTSAPALMALVGGGLAMLRDGEGSSDASGSEDPDSGEGSTEPRPTGWRSWKKSWGHGRFLIERSGGLGPLPVIRLVRDGVETDLTGLSTSERESLAREVERDAERESARVHEPVAVPPSPAATDDRAYLQVDALRILVSALLVLGVAARLVVFTLVLAPLPFEVIEAVLTARIFPWAPLAALVVAIVRARCAALPRPEARRRPSLAILALLLLAGGTLGALATALSHVWWRTYLPSEYAPIARTALVLVCLLLAGLAHAIGVAIGRRADRRADRRGQPGGERGRGPDQPSVNGVTVD